MPLEGDPTPEQLAVDPEVLALLANPLDHTFGPGDRYLFCHNGEPVRFLTVHSGPNGTLPSETSYSFVWRPTMEYLFDEALCTERAVKLQRFGGVFFCDLPLGEGPIGEGVTPYVALYNFYVAVRNAEAAA